MRYKKTGAEDFFQWVVAMRVNAGCCFVPRARALAPQVGGNVTLITQLMGLEVRLQNVSSSMNISFIVTQRMTIGGMIYGIPIYVLSC